jgi:hypothetical protein
MGKTTKKGRTSTIKGAAWLTIIDNIITIITLIILIFITKLLDISVIFAIFANTPFVVWAVRHNENFRRFFKIFYPPYFSS